MGGTGREEIAVEWSIEDTEELVPEEKEEIAGG